MVDPCEECLLCREQLHKRMCKMEEMFGRLPLFLSSSQGSPFSGFQSLASQVDDSKLGTSGAMQRPGQAGLAGAAGREIEMVPASTTDPTATGDGHAMVPGTGKAVHCALVTFRTVYGGGVGNRHWSTMPGGCPTTWDMEVGICHTAPMPGSQTPIRDIEGGICHTAPMPAGQPLIPSHGFISGSGKEMSGAPGTFGSVYSSGVGDSHLSTMPGGHPTTQEMEIGVCHTVEMYRYQNFGQFR
ncbi:hypothetical protein E2C01_068761 [Portunus trituberculatus]|uniref:Uncharacterized protein n=1 Tax=Portunus trituberculatus TaxID=210409 RepID=A0A5B7HWS9_PORTR|nr:hypothetical protein [Portunus trituberculatus]